MKQTESPSELIASLKNNLKEVNRKELKLSNSFIRWKGGFFRVMLTQSRIFQSILFYSNLEYYIHRFSKNYRQHLQRTITAFISTSQYKQLYSSILPPTSYHTAVSTCSGSTNPPAPLNARHLEEEPIVNKLIVDFLYCHKHFKASIDEYFLYEFYKKSDNERSKYITDKYLLSKMSMTGKRWEHDVELNEKYNFYLLTRPLFKREAILVNDQPNFDGFKSFSSKYKRVICKPCSLGCGQGIFIADVSSDIKAETVLKKIIDTKSDWIIEELIIQSDEMSVWNESSVNTIRVNTYYVNGKVELGTSFMRTGRKGFEVDNAAIGGMYAIVDKENGILLTHGKDEKGIEYIVHPDSGMSFKGWQVPKWPELVEIV